MKKLIIIIFTCFASFLSKAQLFNYEYIDTLTTYKSIEKARLNPNQVYALDLTKQKLKTFPEEIFAFKNLNILILKKNKIDQLPDSINQLKYLQILDVSKNKIASLPNEFYELKYLKELNLSQNKIRILSYRMSNFSGLRIFELWGLPIEDLPQDIFQLTDLEYLDLRQIYFSEQKQQDIKQNLPNTKVRFTNMCDCE